VTIPLFTRFWGRSVEVIIDAIPQLRVSNLDDNGPRIAFEVHKNNSKEPDKAVIRMWNLRPQIRTLIRLNFLADDSITVKLKVGYQGFTKQIFQGQARDVEPGRQEGAVDIVTQFIVGDGIDAFREGFVNESFGPGTPMDVVLSSVIAAMGLIPAAGSLVLFQSKLPTSAIGAANSGFVATGKAADILDTLCALTSLRWFIRDNQVVFQDTRTFLTDFAVRLTPGTGLLWASEPHGRNQMKVKALLNPDLQPGRQIILQNELGLPIGDGNYAIESMRAFGDTEGAEWVAMIEEARAIAS
jgi:hypothetical protein